MANYWTPPTFKFGTQLRTTFDSLRRAFTDFLDPLYAHKNNGEAVWVTYTPTHVNLTIGNGVQSSFYHVEGKTCSFRWYFTVGSTTTVGSNVEVGLPLAARNTVYQTGSVWLLDNGTRHWPGSLRISGTTALLVHPDAAAVGLVTATAPFTWTTGDIMVASAQYEIE